MRKSILFLALIVSISFVSCSNTQFEEDEVYKVAEENYPILETEQVAFLKLVNDYRHFVGLFPLKIDTVVYEYAQTHTSYMISKDVLSHDNFKDRVDKIIIETQALAVGENVAKGRGARNVFKNLLNSTKHHEAIVGDYTHTGISVKLDSNGVEYYTQIFSKK